MDLAMLPKISLIFSLMILRLQLLNRPPPRLSVRHQAKANHSRLEHSLLSHCRLKVLVKAYHQDNCRPLPLATDLYRRAPLVLPLPTLVRI